MSVTIEAYREQPIKVPGQVEKVLASFNAGPYLSRISQESPLAKAIEAAIAEGELQEDKMEYPENPEALFSWDEAEDGGQIEITIDRVPEAKVAHFIQALRFCGFVAGVVSQDVDDED